MAAFTLSLVVAVLAATPAAEQSTTTLQGRVFDGSRAVIRGAAITVRDESTGFERSVPSGAIGSANHHFVRLCGRADTTRSPQSFGQSWLNHFV